MRRLPDFYVEDRNNGILWRTPLPFPVHVVSRVEVIDQISGGKLTTEYRYHHGYWDGAEREFRGFGMVEQFDTEMLSITMSPACTVTRPSSPFRRTISRRPP